MPPSDESKPGVESAADGAGARCEDAGVERVCEVEEEVNGDECGEWAGVRPIGDGAADG